MAYWTAKCLSENLDFEKRLAYVVWVASMHRVVRASREFFYPISMQRKLMGLLRLFFAICSNHGGMIRVNIGKTSTIHQFNELLRCALDDSYNLPFQVDPNLIKHFHDNTTSTLLGTIWIVALIYSLPKLFVMQSIFIISSIIISGSWYSLASNFFFLSFH